MKNQPTFSHGLLYSVAPDSFSALHLHDEDEKGKDTFDWEAYETQFKEESILKVILYFLKVTAANWRVISFIKFK